MQILFDQGTLAPLRQFLPLHKIETAYERGWSTMKNGELLQAVETAGFEVLVTTDTNLKYQQNLAVRGIGIVVLSTTSWPRIQSAIEQVVQAIDHAVPGSYVEVRIP